MVGRANKYVFAYLGEEGDLHIKKNNINTGLTRLATGRHFVSAELLPIQGFEAIFSISTYVQYNLMEIIDIWVTRSRSKIQKHKQSSSW